MAISKETTSRQGHQPTEQAIKIPRPRGNDSMPPPPPPPLVEPAPEPVNNRNDEAVLDEFERLAADTILDDDDGDEPGAKEEISRPLVAKNLPKFANFRSNEVTFDMWGTTDREGMDDLVFVTTKKFAPNFED